MIIVLALALDACLGEPRRFHPLVIFGRFAQFAEQLIYRDSRLNGVIAVVLLIAPLTLIAGIITLLPLNKLVDAILLYLCIGWNSLNAHALEVYRPLCSHDLLSARKKVALMVSRDTTTLNQQSVVKAALESTLENGNDAIFGAIFWFILAGAPGAVLYRMSNTLDAMWGYRNRHYLYFGWCAAQLDDLLNFIPARFTALGYAIAGNTGQALACWRTQARHWDSPNAGPVMAAGAGALGVVLGGPAQYHGILRQRPQLGQNRSPETDDIPRALILIRHTLWVMVLVLFTGGYVAELIAQY